MTANPKEIQISSGFIAAVIAAVTLAVFSQVLNRSEEHTSELQSR